MRPGSEVRGYRRRRSFVIAPSPFRLWCCAPKPRPRFTVLVAQLNDVRAQAKGYCVIRSDALTSWNAASGLGARADMGLGRIAVVSAFVLSIPCWPALVNGQPFFTLDTIAYLHAAAHGVNRLLGIEAVWYAPPVAAAGDVGQALPGTQPEAHATGSVVLMARSVFYGLFLLASHALSGLWIAVLAQSAIAAAAIFLTLRSFSENVVTYSITSLLVLAASTPMAFFVSLLMPDILAPVAILACAHIVVRFDRLERWEFLFWFCALCYSMLVHFSHLLTVAGLAILAALLGVRSINKARWFACGTLATAMVIALLGERAFFHAVEKMTGAPPIRPPFLMARIIEDGPGYRYLQATCPHNGLAVCAFRDRFPSSADTFLWATDSNRGVFSTADPQTRRALSAEQLRFAWNVFMYDPVGQASASLVNWMRQLTTFALLTDFSYGRNIRQALAASLPEPYLTRLQATPAARETLPLQAGYYVFLFTVSASGLILVAFFFAYRGTSVMAVSGFWEFAGLVLVGVVLNAAVCGMLSGAEDRYQARVVWLVPLLALIAASTVRRQSF